MNDPVTEHVILYRQVYDDPAWQVQAYCSCLWGSEVHSTANEVDSEIGDHMYKVWLSQQEEPV